MALSSIITGTGAYLPSKILTNFDLEKIVETSDSWIVERTGIKQRNIAAQGELTSDMAYQAALNAIDNSKLPPDKIDLIIVATTTPDSTFPSVAVKVQAKLGLKHGAAFDVQAVCGGFIYALNIADNFIKSGQVTNVLVIGAEKMSSILDWTDRSTCILFGDGAGAVILSATGEDRGIITSKIYSDGGFESILYTDGGVSSTGTSGVIKMKGPELFKLAVEKISSSVVKLMADSGFTTADIDVLVPHQANIRILESVSKRLNLPQEKVICTVEHHANTSAASIPLALNYAIQNNRIKRGDLVVLTAIGAGLCWGANLIRW